MPLIEPVIVCQRHKILIDNIKRAEIRFKGQTINLQDPSLSIRSDEWQSEWPSPYADQNSINDLAMIKLILDTSKYW